MGEVTGLFARPDVGMRLPLTSEPVLESWNAGNHPDQIRLRTYLDAVAEQVSVKDWDSSRPLTFELVVGLPESVPVDRGGRDLDNYLYPIVRRLGAHRVAAAFGHKVRQHGSTIAVGEAMPAEEPSRPAQLTVRTSMSAQSAAWKQAIHQACLSVVTEPLPPGPVALQVLFGVSSHRNWTAL
jgi:hypothetical protein